jgi:hypothetical protein
MNDARIDKIINSIAIAINRFPRGDDTKIDREFNIPVWARRLCEEVHEIIDREDVSLKDVIDADTYASGHVDYQVKFSRNCCNLDRYGNISGLP